jgi:hypothetical protein
MRSVIFEMMYQSIEKQGEKMIVLSASALIQVGTETSGTGNR